MKDCLKKRNCGVFGFGEYLKKHIFILGSNGYVESKCKAPQYKLTDEDKMNRKFKKHIFILGTTGYGKSECKVPQYKLTAEEEMNRKLKIMKNKEKKELKEMKVKISYINNFDSLEELKEDHYHIFEYSKMFLNKEIKTMEDFKIIFSGLPMDLFGQGIAWGFEDTVVREDLYSFFEDVNYEFFLKNYNNYLDKK